MIKLYQLTGYWGIPSPSPFCMKLETYLRMAKIPFESFNVLDPLSAPQNRMAPKKKIPFIEMDGKLIGDSSLIIARLKKKYGDSLDKHLSLEQKAKGLLIQRLFEDHFFWAIVYSRWLDEKGWTITRPEFFGGLRWPLRQIIPGLRKRRMKKVLYHNGVGRHSEEEIYTLAKQDLEAVNLILGDNPFILGDKPSSFDAIVHGFLVNIIRVPFDFELKNYAINFPSFVDYCTRIDNLYYR